MADCVALEWEVLRWRRLKLSLIRACELKALESFLRAKLDYDQYRKHFTDELTTILQDNPRKIRPKITHRRWRASVRGINRMLSTRSKKF